MAARSYGTPWNLRRPDRYAQNMAGKTRTFVAIELSGPTRERIAKVLEHLGPKAPAIRWTETRKLHITLAFLGDVLDVDLSAVCRAVQEAVASLPRMTLELKGFGCFPPSGRPRVVWIGVEGPGVSDLQVLQRAIVAATRAAGYPPTESRFHPHVTIGRIEARDSDPPDIGLLARPFSLWSAGTLDVKRATVFSSSPSREGQVYTVLADAPLSTARSRPGPQKLDGHL
jgi:RNA 2',3'-cyclic 3'-phosphodiesterase